MQWLKPWIFGHERGFYIKTHTVCNLTSSIRSSISLWEWIVFNTHCGREQSQNRGSMWRVSTWSITVNNSAVAPTPVFSNAAVIILFTHLSVVYLLYFILASTEIRNKGTMGSYRCIQLSDGRPCILYRHSWSSKDESYWLLCNTGISSMRLTLLY